MSPLTIDKTWAGVRHAPAHLAALTAALCWSVSFAMIKLARREIDPVPLYLLRFDITAMVVIAISLRFPIQWRGLSKRSWGVVLLLAVLIGPVYQILLMTGATGTSAGLIGMLIATQPLHVAWLGPLFLREKFHTRHALAIGLAFVGVTIPIVFGRELKFATLVGPMLLAIAALVGSINIILPRRIRDHIEPWDLVVLVQIVAALISLPLMTKGAIEQWRSLSLSGWAATVYLGSVGQGLATWLFYVALRRLTAATAAFYLFVMMAFSGVWGRVFLGEPLRGLDFVGMLLVLTGLVLNANHKPGEAQADGKFEARNSNEIRESKSESMASAP